MRILAAAAGLAMLTAGSMTASAASFPVTPAGAASSDDQLVSMVHDRDRHRWHRHRDHHHGYHNHRWWNSWWHRDRHHRRHHHHN